MMFIHLNAFRRKEEKIEVGFSELTRRNRVEKGSRKPPVRPGTAPSSLEWPTENRRSTQYDMPFGDELIRSPMPLHAAARFPTPRDEFPRPPLCRSVSSASCTIRNPFRTETSESIATLTHLPQWSSESGVDVMQGTVPSYTPMRRTTPPCVAPQKAVIFSHSSQSDGTPLDSEPPTMLVVLTRSRSLNNGKASSASAPVRPPLRRSSHEGILTSRRSLRRID